MGDLLLRSNPAPLSVAADGRTITGFLVRYNDYSPEWRETIKPGAFRQRARPLTLNLQHDRQRIIADETDGLKVTERDDGIHLWKRLREDSAELDLCRRGRLTGFSAEYYDRRVERLPDGRTAVLEGYLEAAALVDVPSYPGSQLQVRKWGGSFSRMARLSSYIPGGKKLGCSCSGPQANWASFTDEALAGIAADVAAGTNLMAGVRTFDVALGNVESGALRVAKSDRGLEIEIDIFDTEAGRLVNEMAATSGIVVRPHIDKVDRPGNTVIVGEGDDATMVYETAKVRGMIVTAAGAGRSEGWPTPVIDVLDEAPQQRSSRLLPWL